MSLLERFDEGEIRALSKIVSLIENREEGYEDTLGHLYRKIGNTVRIGVTGPPGAGKSTIVNRLVHQLLKDDKRVGVVAVDPTSPFTGGALLGDRVRMNEFPIDGSFYFRSMATRGEVGGLASSTDNVAVAYDAFGFDVTLIETVGVGQVELDIIDTCDVVVVAVVPESGDAVQTMKAGLMEIADVFCVNKSDRPGSARIVADLRMSLELGNQSRDWWKVPVVATQAVKGENIDGLLEKILLYLSVARESGEFERHRRQQLEKKLWALLQDQITKEMQDKLSKMARIDQIVDNILNGNSDPFSASRELFQKWTDSVS